MEEPVSKPASKRSVAPSKTATGKAVTRKTAAKTPSAKKQVATPKKAVAPKPAKPARLKKPKLVRDSFTLPKEERALLIQLKQRASTLARPSKKSELLRAGIKALSSMTDKAFLAAVAAVPSIKTGRPAK